MTRPLDPGVDVGPAPTAGGSTNKGLVALWSVPPNPPLVVPQPANVYFDPITVTQGNGPTAGDPVGMVAASFADPLSLVGNRLFGQGVQAVVRSWQTYVQ
jgi:hypothetical protein